MGTLLSHDKWLEAKTPMYWIKVSSIKDWDNVILDLADKWAVTHLSGWFYRSSEYWVFEKQEDLVTFKFFILNNKFSEDTGKIESIL